MPRDEFDDEDDRPRRRRGDEFDDEDRRPPRTTMPGTSRAAGVIWIITGSLAVLVLLLGILQMVMSLQGRGPDPFMICGVLFWLTLTLFGLMAGIRTVAGSSSEPIVNGVISILFSLLFLGITVLMILAGVEGGRGGPFGRMFGDLLLVMAVIFGFYGLLLLLAGILVLSGRNEYVRYKAYLRQQRASSRSYDDDFDDRPRRRRRDND